MTSKKEQEPRRKRNLNFPSGCRYWFHLWVTLELDYLITTGIQCCGSKYIEFGSGSRRLAQFGPDPDPGLCFYF